MQYTSAIELSRSALKTNFDYLQSLVGKDCIVSHVVKGNAYGHGIGSFVPLARELGATHFATFDAQEAEQVLKVGGDNMTLMVMGMIENQRLEWAVENGVEFYVFDLDRLRAGIAAAKKVGKKAKIHIEIETGMNRTGFELKDHDEVWKLVRENREHLQVRGICTHFAGAENYANFLRIYSQMENFERRTQRFEEAGVKPEMYHSACSAAAIRFPQTRMDMVRIGIMQYGFWPSHETYITTVQPNPAGPMDPLRRVLSWKSHVMSVKEVEQGDYVGYGTSYLANYDMKIAIVPVGYSHGYTRSLGNVGRALVRGVRVPVIGTVNMNALALDVDQLDHVEKGDEVVLIGKQGDSTISVSSFSEYSEQLNYELLTRLPMDIPRTVVD